MKNRRSPYTLNLIGGIILLVGLGSALLICRFAENDSTSISGYEEGYGSVYSVRPEDSKKFLRDLEVYGGKANMLAYEFNTWFAGLWHGKSLAFTVAAIAIFISLGFFYVAHHRPDLESDISNKNDRDSID